MRILMGGIAGYCIFFQATFFYSLVLEKHDGQT